MRLVLNSLGRILQGISVEALSPCPNLFGLALSPISAARQTNFVKIDEMRFSGQFTSSAWISSNP
jgi:hypothetical protein